MRQRKKTFKGLSTYGICNGLGPLGRRMTLYHRRIRSCGRDITTSPQPSSLPEFHHSAPLDSADLQEMIAMAKCRRLVRLSARIMLGILSLSTPRFERVLRAHTPLGGAE
jgi:hypothetical protein